MADTNFAELVEEAVQSVLERQVLPDLASLKAGQVSLDEGQTSLKEGQVILADRLSRIEDKLDSVLALRMQAVPEAQEPAAEPPEAPATRSRKPSY